MRFECQYLNENSPMCGACHMPKFVNWPQMPFHASFEPTSEHFPDCCWPCRICLMAHENLTDELTWRKLPHGVLHKQRRLKMDNVFVCYNAIQFSGTVGNTGTAADCVFLVDISQSKKRIEHYKTQCVSWCAALWYRFHFKAILVLFSSCSIRLVVPLEPFLFELSCLAKYFNYIFGFGSD